MTRSLYWIQNICCLILAFIGGIYVSVWGFLHIKLFMFWYEFWLKISTEAETTEFKYPSTTDYRRADTSTVPPQLKRSKIFRPAQFHHHWQLLHTELKIQSMNHQKLLIEQHEKLIQQPTTRNFEHKLHHQQQVYTKLRAFHWVIFFINRHNWIQIVVCK